jgi:hypothetical protein
MLGVSLSRTAATTWWPEGAVYAADFVNRRYMRDGAWIPEAAAFTFSRASSAWAMNQAGHWQEYPPNTPRFTPGGLLLEPQRENLIRNNAMAGAAIGTPGTLPNHWGRYRTGTLNEPTVVGLGRRNGVDYVDFRFFGTASGANDLGVFQEALLPIPPASSHFCSAFLELVSGSVASAVYAQLSCGRYLDGAYVSGSPTIDLRQVSGWTRLGFSDSIPFGVNQIRPSVAVRVPNGVSIDAVIRVGWPQIELAQQNASTAIMTDGSARIRAGDALALGLPASPSIVVLDFDDGSVQSLPGPRSDVTLVSPPLNRAVVRRIIAMPAG